MPRPHCSVDAYWQVIRFRYVFWSSVRRQSVRQHLFRVTRYLFNCWRISTKLATNIRHASGNCPKGFQGQRSKVKVTTRPINL